MTMFTPARIGPLELKNRVIVSSMDMYSAVDGTPQAIRTKVSQDIAKALQLPDVREKLLAQGSIPDGAR